MNGETMRNTIIFDMDGVIIDSEPINLQATNDALKKYDKYLNEQMAKQFVGSAGGEYFGKLIQLLDIPTTPSQLTHEWHECVFNLMKGKISPIPGVVKVIKTLQEKRYRLALASSGERRRVMFILDKLSLHEYFPVIITGSDILKGKPDPEIFLKAMQHLNATPRDCAVIEDSDRGIEAAKRANMKAIGFVNPHSYGQTLVKADVKIKSFSEWNE